MGLGWRHVRRIASAVAGLIVAIAFAAPAGEFVIDWLREQHFYDHPSRTVATLLSLLTGVAHNAQFHWIGGITVGFAAGAWLDAFIGRREKNERLKHKQELREKELAVAAKAQRPSVPVQVPATGVRYDVWDRIDPLTIGQAAALWIGEDPPEDMEKLSTTLSVMVRALAAAVDSGDLIAEPSPPKSRLAQQFSEISDGLAASTGNAPIRHDLSDRYTKVSRSSLSKYARKKKERPAFLFSEARAGGVLPPEPKTLHKHFKEDFANVYEGSKVDMEFVGMAIEVESQLHLDIAANAKFMSFFIPGVMFTEGAIRDIAINHDKYMKDLTIPSWHLAERGDTAKTSSNEMISSGRVFVYHEYPLSRHEEVSLEDFYKVRNLALLLRGPDYQRVAALN